MANRRNVIIASGLVCASFFGVAWFLTGQGLDNAEKWVSIVGMFVSVCLGIGGVALGWLTWRQPQGTTPPSRVSASGAGATAIAGDSEGDIDTEVSGVRTPQGAPAPAPAQISASGDGSTAIGGDNRGNIRSRVSGTDQSARP
ncbi:hypothetical protein AB0H83_35735 [Dactylosporangium sp. NPDC050688]|uniref:hypothetical protein n=1 Tax=Dactylosporangium sp. NPDC050688 TaxID=3157217 RepID=UPI0033E2C3CC